MKLGSLMASARRVADHRLLATTLMEASRSISGINENAVIDEPLK